MDSYGCFRVTREDAQQVKRALEDAGSVVFPIGDGQSALIVHVTTKFDKLGVMPFGGNPYGRAYVGVLGRGCSHLGTAETHENYLQEKLGLVGTEASLFAKFWAFMWEPTE